MAVHTSAEPDPYFHTLAYDETKDILVFKVAAATGFDAPRAWTLVSLRKTRGVEFGLQILGGSCGYIRAFSPSTASFRFWTTGTCSSPARSNIPD